MSRTRCSRPRENAGETSSIASSVPLAEVMMEVLHERCAGLDVHKNVVVACARVVVPGAKPKVELLKVGTTTSELLHLGDWLKERGVTHVVMEATGVYWKPVWHLLEGDFVLVL